MELIRVLVVDDHGIIRGAMKSLFDGEQDIRVIGEAASGDEAIEKARLLRPDVALMDIAMPKMNGLEATRRLATECPDLRVVMLTMHEDEEFVLSALRAGAKGYVLKEAEPRELVEAVRTVARGLTYLPPTATRAVVDGFLGNRGHGDDARYALLTPRERDILRHAATGKSNREIAELLVLSMRTVEHHRQSIMHKLELARREDLTRYALRKGLIDFGQYQFEV